jgi:hypothetical protein
MLRADRCRTVETASRARDDPDDDAGRGLAGIDHQSGEMIVIAGAELVSMTTARLY